MRNARDVLIYIIKVETIEKKNTSVLLDILHQSFKKKLEGD